MSNFPFSDSPMDMSLVEGEEKPVDVNEVPEYAEEIYKYLREMEVSSSSQPQIFFQLPGLFRNIVF